ncbi:hypothetical protein ACTXT7_010513 [Hymenolepis weldensis]
MSNQFLPSSPFNSLGYPVRLFTHGIFLPPSFIIAHRPDDLSSGTNILLDVDLPTHWMFTNGYVPHDSGFVNEPVNRCATGAHT